MHEHIGNSARACLIGIATTVGLLFCSPSSGSFDLKFKNKDEFVTWMNANSHSTRYSGFKFFTVAGAIDGGEFNVDGEFMECFVFGAKEPWSAYELFAKNQHAKTFKTFYNARCAGYR